MRTHLPLKEWALWAAGKGLPAASPYAVVDEWSRTTGFSAGTSCLYAVSLKTTSIGSDRPVRPQRRRLTI